MEYLQDLNPQQKQAVMEQHPRVCVIAGPGCGKTKTLVSKAIYLLASQQAQPRNILILTFAKKAIKEIKKGFFWLLLLPLRRIYTFIIFIPFVFEF